MNTQTPAQVAAAYFDALAGGDVPTAMGMFAADAVWHQPGNNRFSGEHLGLHGIGALLGGMMEASEGTFQLTVAGPSMVNGDLVAVPVRFSGERNDASMNMSGVDLITVCNGRIVDVRLFSEDVSSEDAFWG